MTTATHHLSGLPDPVEHGEFYENVAMLRFFAFCIDAAIVTALTGLLLLASVFALIWVLPFLALVVSIAYRAIAVKTFAATLGMKWLGLEIREGNGLPIESPTGTWHAVLFSLQFIIPILLLVNMVLIAVTKFGQGLHDLPLGTTVIRRPVLR